MARSLIPPDYFSPPTLPEASRPPAWVLLNRVAYVAELENATTARCLSSGGDIVEVSFCLAEPPAISHACVHCPGLHGRVDWGFYAVPVVACAEGLFVLLQVSFNFGPRSFCYHGGMRDFFVYRAGPGKPSLRRLPNPFPRDISHWEIGILPLAGGAGGGGEGGFVVAALVSNIESDDDGGPPPFDLHLFSPGAGEWRTVVPRLDPRCEEKVFSHVAGKVIAVGGGVLGWVDLWRGVMLCDVLADDPVLRLLPLPKPTVGRAWKTEPGVIRDVAGDGSNLLSFVEIQFPWSPDDDVPPSSFDGSVSDSDSDTDAAGPSNDVSHGWRATTWTLHFPSDEQWSKHCTVDYSADILGSDPACSELLLPDEQIMGEAMADGTPTLKSLDGCQAPVLRVHDDGVVYMMTELKNTDGQEEAWVAAFDVRRKRLKALAPFLSKRLSSLEDACWLCSFSKYLDVAPPGLKISVDRCREKPWNFFVLVLLAAQNKLRKFKETLEDESNSRPSLHSMRAASLLATIQAVAQYAPRDGEDNANCEVTGKCTRVLKDLESWIVSKPYTDLPASMDIVTSKIHLSLAAIDSLLQILPPTA